MIHNLGTKTDLNAELNIFMEAGLDFDVRMLKILFVKLEAAYRIVC